MKNEQLFVNKPSFINDESAYDLENNLSSTNNSSGKTFCRCEDQASSTKLADFNNAHCNLTESTEFCLSSSQSGNQINSYSSACTISKRKRRSVNNRSLFRRSTADVNIESDDFTDYEPLVYDEDINSTNVVL